MNKTRLHGRSRFVYKRRPAGRRGGGQHHPELAGNIENPEQYDTIILGFPSWIMDMPMPVYSFLEENYGVPVEVDVLEGRPHGYGKLRKLLRHAYGHSAYYRKAFAQAGISEENIDSMPLNRFPVIDKELLMQHFDQLVTDPEVKQEKLRKFDESPVSKSEGS